MPISYACFCTDVIHEGHPITKPMSRWAASQRLQATSISPVWHRPAAMRQFSKRRPPKTAADELAAAIGQAGGGKGPALLVVRCAVGARADLGRPTTTPQENKQAFMQRLQL